MIRSDISNISEIGVTYKGREINNLTFTKVAFWNGGKEAILSNDIANDNYIKILSKPKTEILNFEILYIKEVANNFDVSFDQIRNEILIKFDYVGYGEGIVIKVIHTGISSKDILIDGKFKGLKFESPHTSLDPTNFLALSTYYDDEPGKFYSP